MYLPRRGCVAYFLPECKEGCPLHSGKKYVPKYYKSFKELFSKTKAVGANPYFLLKCNEEGASFLGIVFEN